MSSNARVRLAIHTRILPSAQSHCPPQMARSSSHSQTPLSPSFSKSPPPSPSHPPTHPRIQSFRHTSQKPSPSAPSCKSLVLSRPSCPITHGLRSETTNLPLEMGLEARGFDWGENTRTSTITSTPETVSSVVSISASRVVSMCVSLYPSCLLSLTLP